MSRTDIRTLLQQAVNSYGSGVAVFISASDGAALHRPALPQGQHLCVLIADVDRAAFEQTNANDVLEQALQGYISRWKLREKPEGAEGV
jgi:hypothetical protein